MILLFVYDDWYPIGGANDLVLIAQTLEEVEREMLKHGEWDQNAHAFDADEDRIVKFWTRGYSEDLTEDPWIEKDDWLDERGWRKKIIDLR